MTTLIARKKRDKRKKLLDAAFDLFMEKGTASTTIAEICARADIAKGTFYLYFTDKEDILRTLAKRISFTIIEDSYRSLKTHDNFVEDAVGMADYLIHLFMHDPGLVTILKKDFIWPISADEFMHTENSVLDEIRKEISLYSQQSHLSNDQILFRLFALISMICSVSYSSIIDHFPDDLDACREEIFTMIRQSFLIPADTAD